MAMESVRPAGAGLWLEKTRSEAVLGREALTPAVRSVVKRPLPISPSRPRFALETLCKVGSVLGLMESNQGCATGGTSESMLSLLVIPS